jgi:type I restriction enzyme, S subunit
MATLYPSYRPSGVEWLGNIPAHWNTGRLKFCATSRTSNVDKHTKEDEHPVELCNYVDVYNNDFITSELTFMKASATEPEIERFEIKKGDVLITKDSESWDDIAVPAMVAEDLGGVLCGYHLAIIRSLPGKFHAGYLFRLFCSEMLNYQFKIEANGVTRFGLPAAAIDNALLLRPPIYEQELISGYIDRETARVDALIDKKQRLLELLEEKRLAIITHAVTKGLDPNAPMKDSGIDWLGQVPANWAVLQLKRSATTTRKSFTDGDWIESPYITDEGIRLIQTGNVGLGEFREQGFRYISEETFQSLSCTEVFPGDVLICRLDGPVGRACLAPQLGVRMITSVDNAVLKPNEAFDPRFIVYWLSSRSWLEWIGAICRAGGGFRFRISRTQLGEQALVAPPLAEQVAITDRIDRELSGMARVAEKVEAAIKVLQEYRSALITNAVTGKIDVRGEVEKEAAA